MKNHFLSRFDACNLRKTIVFILTTISLIVISLLIGINDNPPMILLFFTGMILFFFAATVKPEDDQFLINALSGQLQDI